MKQISLFLLSNTSQLEMYQAENLIECLSSTAFVLNSNDKRLPPRDLYDPTVHEFQMLLPIESFPSKSIYEDIHISN